jgi:hypothetical protein
MARRLNLIKNTATPRRLPLTHNYTFYILQNKTPALNEHFIAILLRLK